MSNINKNCSDPVVRYNSFRQMSEQQIREFGWKSLQNLDGKGMKTWNEITQKARGEGLNELVDKKLCWFEKPVEISNQELFVVAPQMLQDLESCKDQSQLQMALDRYNMTNRELRKMQSQVFKISSSCSLSLEKVVEMAVPPGLKFHNADAIYATGP